VGAARTSALATCLLASAANLARADDAPAQPRPIFETGPAVESSVKGATVLFQSLLEASVAAWTTAGPAPRGGCLYTVQALPIRPTSLAWQGKPKEVLRTETASSGTACSRAPAGRIRVLGSEVWAALADDTSVRVAGLDYDGKPIPYAIPPQRIDTPGSIDLFRVGDVVALKTGGGLVGWKLEPTPSPVKNILAVGSSVTAAHPAGWVVSADGALRRMEDPTARAPRPVARLPGTPASDPPLLADDGQNLVVVSCPGGSQIGVWRIEGEKARPRKVFTGHDLGCPRAARVTEDGRILIASQTPGKNGRRAAHLTLIGRSGKPLGVPLRIDLDPSPERELGLAYAGGNGRLLWATIGSAGAVVHGADFTALPEKLVWSSEAH
jgi:hypothetical protein